MFCLGISFTYAQSESTLDSLQRAITKFDNQKNKSENHRVTLQDSTKCTLWIQLALEYNETNPNKALLVTQKALDLSSKINFQKGIALSYTTLGKIYIGKADFALAIKNITKAIKINTAIKAQENLADSYFTLGQAYLFLNNYTLALKNLNIALGTFQKLGKTSKEARVYNNMAILFGKLDNHTDELLYYNKALDKLKNDHSDYGENLKNVVNTNIGHVYSGFKAYEKSNAILEQNIDYVIKHHKTNGLGLIYLRMGGNYRGLQQFDKSLFHLEKALSSFRKIQNKSGEGDALRSIGETYFEMNQLDKAEQFTQSGLQLSKQIGELESEKFGYEILAKIYSKKGNYQKAYENHVRYKTVSDQMFNEQISSKLTQIQLSHEFEQKQNVLKQEQEKKDSELKKNTIKEKRIRYIIVLSLFLLSVITVGVYVNLKRYKKQKNIIEKQKEQIQNSLLEKETLLREIHHRVKNNLQIISSLLNMQSEEIDDTKVLASIQEGQSRVQAMSLIHQNLYQSDEIDKVDVENYLKELTDYLTQMFVGDSKSILVYVATSNLKFDFDTAIPLGLIVNELVSNAFKYAFKDKKEGRIWIKINAITIVDYELLVEDDGDALPKDFNSKNSKSLGLKLVSILSKQLRGNFSVAAKDGKTIFTVAFKDLKQYQSTL